ncbi:leucine-rich repeat-containing protein 42 isoform X2 [Ambystoma mexicanum]|uniref:leucine-rich repeat-containing protein 42 isoform X2 n=1 Tax=Ambystoma mexicanum TaxID=8296 RepID=UPI0037E85EA5
MSVLRSMSSGFHSEVNSLEIGPVYVRENGKLHLANETSDRDRNVKHKPKGTLRLFTKGFSVELCMKKDDPATQRSDHFIFTYTKEGSLRYTAKSLFNMVLGFISDNVHHVDSLLDFPEQIAEKLFSAAEARQKFAEPITGSRALHKFTEAYGKLVLSSLCLRNRHLVVSEKLEDIKSFQQLTSLDLSFCKLGDGHELLEHLTTEPLSSLIQLYLRDNGLSDAGIRKMTAPVRVMKRGLPNLQVFDLSCNPNITERGVAFLFGFRKLNCLDVSETGVQDKKAVRQKIMDNLGLVYAEDPLKEFDHLSCKTQGWAEQVVRQWDQAISEAVKPKDSLKYRTAARNFYGKVKRFYPEETPAFVDAITCGRLQFYSKVTGLTHTPLLVKESADFKDAETENTKKRTHDSQSKEEDNSSNTVKRKCTHFSLEDWDLIKTY